MFSRGLKHFRSGMKKVFSFLAFLLVGLFGYGQVKFYASLNTKSVPVNQNFQLSYTVENGEGRTLKLPNLNEFNVLSGPNTSQSMQWVNGNVSQSSTYSYILQPKKEGTFKIGKAIVNVGGANLESNELSITVTGPAQQKAQQRQNNSPFGFDPFEDPFGDPFEAMAQQQEEDVQPSKQALSDIDKQIRENVFVRMVTNKNAVYEGEPINATLKLYYRLNFGNVQMSKAPKFDGFWSQEGEQNPNQKPTVETINGQQFYVLEIQKYTLFPQRSGALQISPTELNMIVQVQVQSKRRSVWDIFGGAQLQNVPYKPVSNGVTINVKALPEAGKPENFSGAVGKFTFQTNVSQKESKTDEGVTYTVKVSGTGNMKTFELPKPNVPDGFEVYDPKTKEDIVAGTSGTKQADYLIIPRQPGEFKIEPLSFSFFDPSQGKYVNIQAPEYALKISGEPSKVTVSNGENILNSTSKKEIKSLGSDIRFIKTKAELLPATTFVGSPLQYGLMAAPFLLFIGAFAFKRNADKQSADVLGSKLRKANKMAKKRLAVAEKHLRENNGKLFYDEVSRALLGYVSDKLHIDVADLSKDNIEEKLRNKNVDEEKINSLKQLLETCEFALYTNLTGNENMQQQYTNAVTTIAELEDELKNA